MTLKAIIFDMDGVLLDSERMWPEIEYERYEKLIPGWSWEDHGNLTGLSLNDSYRMFVDRYGLDMTWEEYDTYYRRMARTIYTEKASFYPGAHEVLRELMDLEIPMGLATSSPKYWLDIIYERFPLRDYFPVIMSADDVNGNGKPAPDIYELATKNMGFDTAECIAIEDSYNGILSAKRAGLFTIGFRNGHNDTADLSMADLEIREFTGENRERIIDLIRGED